MRSRENIALNRAWILFRLCARRTIRAPRVRGTCVAKRAAQFANSEPGETSKREQLDRRGFARTGGNRAKGAIELQSLSRNSDDMASQSELALNFLFEPL